MAGGLQVGPDPSTLPLSRPSTRRRSSFSKGAWVMTLMRMSCISDRGMKWISCSLMANGERSTSHLCPKMFHESALQVPLPEPPPPPRPAPWVLGPRIELPCPP